MKRFDSLIFYVSYLPEHDKLFKSPTTAWSTAYMGLV